jgi:hypothetical protein
MFKNMTTSKWLTYIITFAYITQIGVVSYVRTKYNVDLTPLLNYTTPLEFTIICAYFGKSSYENNIKMKNSIDTTLQAESQVVELSQGLGVSNQIQEIVNNPVVAEDVKYTNYNNKVSCIENKSNQYK